MAKFVVNTLGHSGVIIDQNPLEPTLPNNALVQAQNATHDLANLHAGAVRKRPGLKQFNIVWAGGPILGGIPMPVAGTGGAPVSGGGSGPGGGGATGGTGTPVGAGNSTGAPGGTAGGGAISSGAGGPAGTGGASIFGGGAGGVGTIFGGRRLVVFGRADTSDSPYNSSATGNGWYVTTASFATDTPIELTSPGPPAVPRRPGLVPAVADDGSIGGVGDQMSCIVADANNVNWLYYPQNFTDNTLDQRPNIRKTNGIVDTNVCTIPKNPATIAFDNSSGSSIELQSVTCMHAGSDGNIYILVADKYRNTGATQPGKVASGYVLNPTTGTLSMVFQDVLATDRITLQCNLFSIQGQSYLCTLDFIGKPDVSPQWQTGVFRLGSTGANGGLIGFTDFDSGNAHFDGGTTMIQFNGRLFVGTRTNSAVPAQPELYSRDPTVAVFTQSAWTANASIKALLPSASNLSRYTSMCVFNGNLYVGYYDYGTSAQQIFKGVATAPGDPTNTGFTFTQVLRVTNTDPFLLNTDNGVLYACKAAGASVGAKLYSSADGTTWSAATVLSTFSDGSYPLFGLFFGVNQT